MSHPVLRSIKAALAVGIVCGLCTFANADDDGADVEAIYDRLEDKQVKQSEQQINQRKKEVLKDPERLSDLATLEPFKDIAVIQRRFLPKTGRFEFSGAGLLGINNAFFTNVGGAARLGYYFTERWGIEASYLVISNSQRQVTKNLEDNQDVQTSNLVTADSYYGGAVKWSPFYGKISWLNKSIISFDTHFLVGGGFTSTEYDDATTIHLGVGQTFASSKSWAFRWDFRYNFYSPETVTVTSGVSSVETQNQSDLILAFGFSFFFPEASYR